MVSQAFQDELAQDLQWDKDNPSEKLQYISHLASKWVIRQLDAQRTRARKHREYLSTKRNWHDYYSGVINPNFKEGIVCPVKYDRIVIRDEIIPSLEELQKIQSEISDLDVIVEFCAAARHDCHSLSYHIQHHLTWLKYMSGAD